MENYALLAASMATDVRGSMLASINVSNIATPGFKRFVPASEDGLASRDLTPGKAYVTGRPLDIYLSENTFLEVVREGVVRYMKAGRLELSAAGQLHAGDGWMVNVAGAAGPLPSSVRITASGELEANGRSFGRLVLVSGSQPHMDTSGLYSLSSVQGVVAGTPQVQSGALEASNVRLTDEIVEMMRNMRHLESMQRVLRQQESLNERVFSLLAKF